MPWKSNGRRSLEGCSPWGRWGSDTTERLHFHFSLPCIREGNGNPLQSSCLENPREGEPGGLLSMGSHRVGHDWSDLAAAAATFKNQIQPLGGFPQISPASVPLLHPSHYWYEPIFLKRYPSLFHFFSFDEVQCIHFFYTWCFL